MLPDGLKAGEAVFVWSWFNRIGNREMYMNCAPITIGGSGTSDDVFNALPDMFVANINGAPKNACTTSEGIDIVFPEAGANVLVDQTGKFGAACAGGPSTPGSGSTGGNTPAPPPTGSTSVPPSVVTAPALIGGPAVDISTGIIGTSFSDIGAPSSEAPVDAPVQTTVMSTVVVSPPVQTTFMTMSTTVAADPVEPTVVPSSTTEMAAPQPTQTQSPGGGSTNGSDTFVVGPCDNTKSIIMCGSDPTTYTQCFDNNMAYGPFAVPPGTECDSTGMGGFKATKPVSRRLIRRNLSRSHRRSFVHSHGF
ncbi:hypothetical protein ABW20_dc0102240 [Dactylellina cionopaga]|nr:hypothetical protein ABW20_dc0102240 [Dactylellina cionopaga]